MFDIQKAYDSIPFSALEAGLKKNQKHYRQIELLRNMQNFSPLNQNTAGKLDHYIQNKV
jgi:hypothetical protein